MGILPAVVIAVGGFLIMNDQMNYIDLITFTLFVSTFVTPIRKLAQFAEVFSAGMAGIHRFEEIMAVKPTVVEKKDAGTLKVTDGAVDINNISFSYNADIPVLKNVDLHVKGGEMIAVVGASGGGKTTLCSLIPRFYDATEGRILIKDQPIEDYHYDTLRHMIGIVPQSATLFSGTIKENLLWGNSSASDEDLNNAIKISQAKEFIDKLPDGLKTKIEAGGKNVSGGQRQRLTIARALVRKPEILILDDSASALDFATDAIMNSDKILVLDHGKLAAMGTHDELLQTCTLYQEIVKSQMEGENNEK